MKKLTYNHLSSEERDKITVLRAQGKSIREIARRLRSNLGALSRELQRNKSPTYNAANEEIDKNPHLKRASIELEKLRIFIRLAFDLRLVNTKKCGFACQIINEIGRMLGGWLKSINACKFQCVCGAAMSQSTQKKITVRHTAPLANND
jgi:IS30 family transposase